MKRILLLLLTALAFNVSAQVNYASKTIDVATMGASDTLQVYVAKPGQWALDVHWVDVVGSGGTVDVYYGNSDTTYAAVSHAGLPYTLTGATGTQLIYSAIFPAEYISFVVTKNSMTAGTIYLDFNQNRLR